MTRPGDVKGERSSGAALVQAGETTFKVAGSSF